MISDIAEYRQKERIFLAVVFRQDVHLDLAVGTQSFDKRMRGGNRSLGSVRFCVDSGFLAQRIWQEQAISCAVIVAQQAKRFLAMLCQHSRLHRPGWPGIYV